MLRATALAAGLLTFSASASEPRHMPPGLQAVRVIDGTARLVLPGATVPDGHLTLLPEGVFFTNPGYDALNIATQQLQANLKAMEGRVREYEHAALVPCPTVEAPTLSRWTTGQVILAVVAGVLVGAGGVVVLTARGL